MKSALQECNGAREELPESSMTGSQEAVLARTVESTWRLKTLVDQLYYWYMSQGVRMGSQGGIGALCFPPSAEEVQRYVRYFVLELQDFAGLFERNFDTIMSAQKHPDPQKLCTILEGQQDTIRFVREMGRDLGTGSAITLGEMASRVDSQKLENILIYARLVVEFQGDIIARRKGRSNAGINMEQWNEILARLNPRTASDADRLSAEYNKMPISIDAKAHKDIYGKMYGLYKGMDMLLDILKRSIKEFEDDPIGGVTTVTMAAYTIRYMIIDLHNFAELCNKLGLSTISGLSSRYEMYRDLQNQWFAHDNIEGCPSTRQLLCEKPTLITHICGDVEEAKAVMNSMQGKFAHSDIMPSNPTYSPNFADIDKKLALAQNKVIRHALGDPENRNQEKAASTLRGIFEQGATQD